MLTGGIFRSGIKSGFILWTRFVEALDYLRPDSHSCVQSARLVAVSLYSGGGGLDYGIEAAGFDVAVSTDFDHDSCETLRQHGARPVVERSIFDLPTEELLAEGGLEAGEVDLLIGGPPCQPFSKSGYWARGDT